MDGKNGTGEDEMSKIKLKPCPFCGEIPKKITAFIHISHEVRHKKTCWFYQRGDYDTYIFNHKHHNMDKRNWNRRAKLDNGN